jgi:ABC-2 type transport system permease protein
MNKILLIIQREYLSRVKKKSFVIMTILGPILMAGLIIGPALLTQVEDTELKTIAVVDSSYIMKDVIQNTKYLRFVYPQNTDIKKVKKDFNQSGYYAILYIPHVILNYPGVQLYSDKQPNLDIIMHISNSLEKEIERLKLKKEGVDENMLKSIKTSVDVKTIKLTEEGKEKEGHTGFAMVVGIVSGIIIYFFIFMYGAQVMRGVIEEKISRIVEIIVSSVKPFQLMMGKIVGVALVGLTQFFLWIIFTVIIVVVVQSALFPDAKTILPAKSKQAHSLVKTENSGIENQKADVGNKELKEFKNAFNNIDLIDFGVMLGSFLFYFIGGYLLYASLFAAIGAAVDSEADTQQFMMPVTVPLILSIVLLQNIIMYPEGNLAFWFSLIPLTSPVVMMVRIPFGVPYWQVGLSAVILILSFILSTWMAAKIYRTGILMYGKKVNYKELWKWIRYSG